jgi:hypothetical protein
LADVSVGNLTVTEERQQEADFIPGDEGRKIINEVVVTGPNRRTSRRWMISPGKTIHVRKASSYYDSLQKQNEQFKRRRQARDPARPRPRFARGRGHDGDARRGLIEVMVVDDWKAHMWAQVLPKLKVRH